MSDKIFVPQNKNAQQCVRNVMKYLSDITYEKIVTGQHTQSMAQEELEHIRAVTGKLPALVGFELLSYSPNINYADTDDECMTEVQENYGTLKRAWEWAAQKGLITFTWHWFSPLGGRSKSFFTCNTDFDASKAVIDGTPEHRALISDMDCMAGLLRPFCDKQIPILWRPFHESEGTWFWWSAKGGAAVAELWRIMYRRFTEVHGLNNLIWVWNGTLPECYPGDEYVDILGVDIYEQNIDAKSRQYQALVDIAKGGKLVTISECGNIPDPAKCMAAGNKWSWFMVWCNSDSSGNIILSPSDPNFKYNTGDYWKQVIGSPYVINREDMPSLK